MRSLPTDYTPINYPYRDLVRDLWRFLRPYRWRFAVATFFRLTSDLVWLYPAYALATIVTFLSHYSPGEPLAQLWTIAALWVLAAAWRIGGQATAKFLGYQVAERVALDARLEAMQRLTQLDTSWHERENAGNKLKRIDRGSMGLNRIIRIWFNNIIEISVNFVGVIVIISTIDNFLMIVMLTFMILYLTVSSILMRYAARAENIVNAKDEDIHGFSFETINNIRTVKVLDLTRSIGQTLLKETADLFLKIKHRIFVFQGRGFSLALLGYGVRIGTIFFIIAGIIRGRYEVGMLILFQGYFNNVWESVNELSEITQDFVVAKYGVARMMQILDEPVIIGRDEGKVNFPNNWSVIELRNISFAYDDTSVLQNVSLTIRRGEKIGIVGLSGAGKSTLFKLLLKEHEQYTGEILFDQVPLRTIKKGSYLTYLTAVLQETEVFNLSLRDNITIAKTEAETKSDDLERALEIAHVRDFLPKLPKGVETYIGEKGFKLSGGEKQRVGIARAVFKQPQILLLDEATSHLDIESERNIQDSLHTFFQTVTAIVIAHRLTTIKEMDRIVVLESGQIIESGSFDQLYNKRGRFFELWEKQKL